MSHTSTQNNTGSRERRGAQAVSRSAAALMRPHRQSCQSARPCLTYYRALSHRWSEDGQLSVDKKACVSLRTDACQSNCQAWTTAWFSPALWSCSACPPVASPVLLQRASATRLNCLPVLFDYNATAPLAASWIGLTECLKWRPYTARAHLSERSSRRHGDGTSSWICDSYIVYSKLRPSDIFFRAQSKLLNAICS